MVGLILVAVVVLAVALWVGRRRPEPPAQVDDRSFVYRPRTNDDAGSTPPGPAPRASQPSPALPERDNWETGILINEEKQIAIELPAWIHYRDATGQESRRDILVKRLVEQREGGEAILAFCEARKANRTFVVARILQFVDRQTGEVVDHVSDYLRTAYRESPQGRVERALSERSVEANVLAFIARADGSMRQKQRDAVAAYFVLAEPSLVGCEAELSTAISRLSPVQSDYRKQVREAKTKSVTDQAALLAAAENVAATRTTKREFTDSALQVVRKALGTPTASKLKTRETSDQQKPKEI